MVDRTVLQYQLVEKLGAGGMGEVYKARDTRLKRFVAMKVLPAGMSADPERRRRFVHEAQAASALNHPNIITIYDIVTDGDIQYMVMEYVVGKTLLELIPKDGLRVPEAILYAAQMADALCVAHDAGIIHRDLKPANVMVGGSGLVKLLDFGLAKLIDRAPVDDNAETATRIEAPLTVEGGMLGTVNYMSPEQAEGRKLDARSDIFSFGAVLYEMLTGRCAFRGIPPSRRSWPCFGTTSSPSWS
jgi:serine/threonine-protein kinase